MKWIQEPGECCGFSATTEDGIVRWEDKVCGKGVMHSGEFSLILLERAVAKVADVTFNCGEAAIQINDEVSIIIDEYEISLPGCEGYYILKYTGQ